jgi:phosphoserine phosphatase
MDVDSTLINEEVIDLLARKAGVESEVVEITARAMKGEIEFVPALKSRVLALKGAPVSILQEVANEISFTPGAIELIEELKARDWIVGAVSGGFKEILKTRFLELNLDFIVANSLEILDEKLSGRLLGVIIDKDEKLKTLLAFAQKNGIKPSEVVAIGDGANDLEMVKGAGLGIAFCAKPILKEQAHLAIETRDLRLVLDHLD